jgi:ABC-type sugar transport system substrate-binding protein
VGPAAARFCSGGLAALIAAPHPQAEPVFIAVVTGAPRLPWTAHADPRAAALAAGFGLLLQAADGQPHADQQEEVAR